MAKLLEVEDLSVSYRTPRGPLQAVSHASFSIQAGETLGLVGESGCGKSSLAKAIVRLAAPSAGQIRLDGVDIAHLSGAALKAFRPRVQIVFQDPLAALDPRRRIGESIAEPLLVARKLTRAARDARVIELMQQVGLRAEFAARLPHELSGGQRQRVVIARALASNPSLLVCDEPVSALDVSLQAQILNLLASIQRERGVSYLLVSHDLSVVQHLSDRIAVMYLGEIIEIGARAAFWRNPAHPYTRALIESVPKMRGGGDASAQRIGDKHVLAGDLPSPYEPPSGCRFRTRCPHAMPICASQAPPLRHIADDHAVACHLYDPAIPVAEPQQVGRAVPLIKEASRERSPVAA
ncbi:MAG: ABC transporter ATP-binding protein [Janthinobacterium lividum]